MVLCLSPIKVIITIGYGSINACNFSKSHAFLFYQAPLSTHLYRADYQPEQLQSCQCVSDKCTLFGEVSNSANMLESSKIGRRQVKVLELKGIHTQGLQKRKQAQKMLCMQFVHVVHHVKLHCTCFQVETLALLYLVC